MRTTSLLGVLLMCCELHVSPGATSDQPTGNPLESVLLEALRAVNPEIGEAAVLELQAPFPGGPLVLLGWGVRADRRFQGDFRDELFGVFLVDHAWSRIERTLEILPTPRWLDYELRIESVTDREVVLVGRGATYGDEPIRRTYSIRK